MSETEALKIHETHEQAEIAHANKALAPVSLTMAILAVTVAAISLLSHRAHTEVLLAQTRANFQKAQLVGMATQQHADAALIDVVSVLNSKNTIQVAELREKFNREMERYTIELERTTTEERRLEDEGQRSKRKANRLDIAELLCEMALVLFSITLLTRQRRFWFAGIAAAAVGFVMAATAFWVT